MRRAMAEAVVGDDVYGEDPTVNRLEALGARMVGKEAAVLMPSGTMANQAAVMTHTLRGDEVILEADSHIFFYEMGGMALLSGVHARTIVGDQGVIAPSAVRDAIRPDNIHFPRTSLLCLENTHNRSGGRLVPVDIMDALADVAHEAGVAVHLDGARIFNAALALGVPASRLARNADSVMFCLSKALSAPVGSILAGSAEFIARARRARKVLGGGMRQAGVLAAAGLVALETMVDRLGEDHRLARRLAEGLHDVPGLVVDPSQVETNIVAVSLESSGSSASSVVDLLAQGGVLANASGPFTIRLVTHKDVGPADIDDAVTAFHAIMREIGD